MNRRSFLSVLAGLPIVGRLVPQVITPSATGHSCVQIGQAASVVGGLHSTAIGTSDAVSFTIYGSATGVKWYRYDPITGYWEDDEC